MDRKYAKLFAGAAAVALAATSLAAASAVAQEGEGYNIGFSNSGGVGNGWREEQLCSVRAQAAASGQVASLTDIHRDTDQTGQLEDIRNLIAAGVDAIVLNPSSPDGLNSAIQEATGAGITVVAVDAEVTEPSAFILSNNQKEYAELGAEWLFEKIGGEGNVLYMRGIAGHPADDSRHQGWEEVLANYPGITVVERFSQWDPALAKQQMSDLLLSGEQIDGIWTSGLGKSVVDAYTESGTPLVPVVGADNAGFVGYLAGGVEGLEGAAVTNPGTVGGAGVELALRILEGDVPDSQIVYVDPVLWVNDTEEGLATIQANVKPDLDPLWPVLTQIEGWTEYTDEELIACAGPA
jgi:ribose transport system substrate-binding protein